MGRSRSASTTATETRSAEARWLKRRSRPRRPDAPRTAGSAPLRRDGAAAVAVFGRRRGRSPGVQGATQETGKGGAHRRPQREPRNRGGVAASSGYRETAGRADRRPPAEEAVRDGRRGRPHQRHARVGAAAAIAPHRTGGHDLASAPPLTSLERGSNRRTTSKSAAVAPPQLGGLEGSRLKAGAVPPL